MIPSLYDIVTRQAVLIEGLKLDRNQQFAGVSMGLANLNENMMQATSFQSGNLSLLLERMYASS